MTPATELAAAWRVRFLGVLEAYLDESESLLAKPRVFVVAGWFGDGEAWRQIEEQWRAALSHVGLPEFHSSDCLRGYGPFAYVCEDKRRALRTQLVELLNTSRILGACAVTTFDETAGPVRKRRDYASCLYECMSAMTMMVGTYPPGERIAFMVDQRSYVQELQEVWRMVREDAQLSEPERVGPAAFYSRREVVPLQAADLLAHEMCMQRVRDLQGLPPRAEYQTLIKRVLQTVAHWDQQTRELYVYDEAGQDWIGPSGWLGGTEF
jgi:hypothetical protein